LGIFKKVGSYFLASVCPFSKKGLKYSTAATKHLRNTPFICLRSNLKCFSKAWGEKNNKYYNWYFGLIEVAL